MTTNNTPATVATVSAAEAHAAVAPAPARKISRKDVIIEVLSGNTHHGVGALLPHMKNPYGILMGAVEQLQSMGQTEGVASLKVFMRAHDIEAPKTGTRGRSAPSLGETRKLKVQEVNGSRFVRLNTMALDVAKGGSLTVEYRQDGTILIKAG